MNVQENHWSKTLKNLIDRKDITNEELKDHLGKNELGSGVMQLVKGCHVIKTSEI